MMTNRLLPLIFGTMLLIGTWWMAVEVFGIPQYLMPTPSDVATTFLQDPLEYCGHAGRTLLEAFLGFLMALASGLTGGALLFRFAPARRIVLPWTSALQAIPLVAIAPLLVVWCGSGIKAKVLMSAIISFFPILNAVLVGFAEVDQDRRLLFKVYRTGYLMTLRHLLIPSGLPTIIMGIKISAGLATVGAIVAELTGADTGLGHLLLNATYRLETPRLFVAIIMSGLIGWAAFSLPDLVRVIAPRYWESARTELS